MNELRWILLGLGLLLIGVIYFLSRRGTSDQDDSFEQSARVAPQFDEVAPESELPSSEVPAIIRKSAAADDAAALDDDVATTVTNQESSQKPETERREPPLDNDTTAAVAEKVIALHLVPNPDQTFQGTTFVDALQAEGLQFGRFDIFHRFVATDHVTESTPSLFSVANIIKPGTLSLNDLDRQELKGASMFLVLPGPEDPVAAFADMVATGRRLAATLNGQLLDGHGTKLSRQRASHLREDIINYQHGISTADTTIA